MAPEKDYIGFDPVAWVERLLEVNDGSQFTSKEQARRMRDGLRRDPYEALRL